MVGSWGLAYALLTDQINKSSSLVQQTVFSLENNEVSSRLFGQPIEVCSRIKGEMNQYKGNANISFRCRGTKSMFHDGYILMFS